MSESNSTKICRFTNCGRKVAVNGLCDWHRRQERAGIPLKPIRFKRPWNTPPVIEFDLTPCNVPGLDKFCHTSRAAKNDDGYAHVRFQGKIVAVHRYVWERDVGPIPKRKVIDHRCRNHACCNVKHLRVVTHKVNSTENVIGIMWQMQRAKTHCPKGHPYDETNTYIYHRRGSYERQCRQCQRDRRISKLASR